MKTKLTALCILAVIGLSLYCADLSRTTRRLREMVLRSQDEQWGRDLLFGVYADTFEVPPCKHLQIRFVFTVGNTNGEIELYNAVIPAVDQDKPHEYILVRHHDTGSDSWRGGFIIRKGNASTVSHFRPITHPLLSAKELSGMLQRGDSTFSGFGAHFNGTLSERGREVQYKIEVSE